MDDVAARLSAGQGALDELRTYVQACRARGYQDPELTAGADPLGQRYLAEEGLDLGVLDADCAALRGGAAGAAEQLRVARAQAAALTQAWAGAGGAAVTDFVGRHCNSAAMVADGLQVAADACRVLRDALWRVVDARVRSTVATADRAAGQRGTWLVAARAVLAGQPDQGRAGEIVDGQLIPFVDSAIRVEWLDAMRQCDGDATAAYRSAIDAIGAGPPVRFEIPGGWSVAPPAAVAASAPPAVVPATDIPVQLPELPPDPFPLAAEQVMPAGTAWPAPVSMPATLPNPPNPLESLAPAIPPMSSGPLPGFGTPAMPDLGGAATLPGRFAEGLADLFGTPDSSDPGVDEPDELDEPDNLEDSEAEDDDLADDLEESDTDPVDEEVIADEPAADSDPESVEPAEPQTPPAPTEPAPAPTVETAPPAPAPEPASPEDAEKTPCEIAADELPQAGR